MELAAKVLVLLVAILHVYFLVLEMFLWTTPVGLRTFGRTREWMESTAGFAKNQGLYNGFLAAGLVWSVMADAKIAFQLQVFFLACVLLAGVYGGVTVARKILFVQAVPALVALVVAWLAGGGTR